jgi:hypothetical protein
VVLVVDVRAKNNSDKTEAGVFAASSQAVNYPKWAMRDAYMPDEAEWR